MVDRGKSKLEREGGDFKRVVQAIKSQMKLKRQTGKAPKTEIPKSNKINNHLIVVKWKKKTT